MKRPSEVIKVLEEADLMGNGWLLTILQGLHAVLMK